MWCVLPNCRRELPFAATFSTLDTAICYMAIRLAIRLAIWRYRGPFATSVWTGWRWHWLGVLHLDPRQPKEPTRHPQQTEIYLNLCHNCFGRLLRVALVKFFWFFAFSRLFVWLFCCLCAHKISSVNLLLVIRILAAFALFSSLNVTSFHNLFNVNREVVCWSRSFTCWRLLKKRVSHLIALNNIYWFHHSVHKRIVVGRNENLCYQIEVKVFKMHYVSWTRFYGYTI